MINKIYIASCYTGIKGRKQYFYIGYLIAGESQRLYVGNTGSAVTTAVGA